MDMEPTDKDRDSSITWEEYEASEAGDVYTWLMHTRKCNESKSVLNDILQNNTNHKQPGCVTALAFSYTEG